MIAVVMAQRKDVTMNADEILNTISAKATKSLSKNNEKSHSLIYRLFFASGLSGNNKEPTHGFNVF